MRVKGREEADYGFRKIETGWYTAKIVEMTEKIKDGAVALDKNNNPRMSVCFVIDDEESEFNNYRVWKEFSANTDYGERVIADLLCITGLEKTFNEKYPDDASYFDTAVLMAVKAQLPERFVKVYVDYKKNSDWPEPFKLAGANAVIKDTGKAKGESSKPVENSNPKWD